MPRLPTSEQLPEAVHNTAVTVEDVVSSVQDLWLTLGPDVGAAVLNYIATHHAPPTLNGADLNDQLRKIRMLPTGCTDIDGMLRGGFREGTVTEVCGESATGKTQLCTMLAAMTAARGERVLYIDTSNAFTGSRFMKMLGQIPGRQVSMEVSLNSVHVIKAFTVHEVLAALDNVLASQSAADPNHDATAATPKVIIVDSIGAVLSPVLGGGGQHSQGHALLTHTAFTLKTIAHQLRAAVLVTNHMVGGGNNPNSPYTNNLLSATGVSGTTGNAIGLSGSGSGSNKKRPALGESWVNQPHLRLLLWLPGAGGHRVAQINPGPQVGDKTLMMRYRIDDKGLVGVQEDGQ